MYLAISRRVSIIQLKTDSAYNHNEKIKINISSNLFFNIVFTSIYRFISGLHSFIPVLLLEAVIFSCCDIAIRHARSIDCRFVIVTVCFDENKGML